MSLSLAETLLAARMAEHQAKQFLDACASEVRILERKHQRLAQAHMEAVQNTQAARAAMEAGQGRGNGD